LRTILISGANRGIGKAIAKRAINDGHRVSLGVKNPDELIGSDLDPRNARANQVIINQYDARNQVDAYTWVKNTKEKFDGFDALINCAGIFKRTPFNFKEHEEQDINELLKVNLFGPWILCKEAWEELISQPSGRIVFLVSMSGKRSKGNLAGYSVSKFALMGLCQTIRNEGWKHGLRVTAISPSWVNTDMAAQISALKKEEMTQPEDIGAITSTILQLPNSSVPFDVSVNCNLEL